jgi:two-component system sensor histidine kinase HydH
MKRFRLLTIILLCSLLLSAAVLWFAVAAYRSADPVARAILQGLALSLGQAIESVAMRDASLQQLTEFRSRDIAYFAVLDQQGRFRFHSNPDLIGEHADDQRFARLFDVPELAEERIQLGTGELIYETQQQLHLPGEILVLRLALHTWQADQIIQRARTNLTMVLVLLSVAWLLGVASYRLVRRDQRRSEELARQEQLAQLGSLGAVMAHEVRTPLAGIKGFAQLLGEQLADPRQQRHAARIVAESERLEGLVNDLLTYARQEPFAPGQSDPAAVVHEVREGLAAAAALSGVELVVAGTIARPVACPADRLRQLVMNLFTNALQAMPDGGIVRVMLADDRRMAQLTIADSGSGFSEAALERAGTPFFTTRANGSGLGLAICRKLAEGYGGAIMLRNGDAGGAEVCLTLPLVREQV